MLTQLQSKLINCTHNQLFNIFVAMGVCGNKDTKSTHNLHTFDVIPPDTEDFKSVNLPMLSFYVLLSDIKIKKCQYDFVSLKLLAEGIQSKQLPLRQIDYNHKAYWKINHTFQFKMTEYQLRKQFAVIQARDKKGEFLGHLKLNLYTIWVGPYHLDFQLCLPKSKLCRLSLNFKISQQIHLLIQTLSTKLIPSQKPYLQDRFTLSVEAIIGEQIDPSTYAYHICVKQSASSSPRQSLIETHSVDPYNLFWTNQLAQKLHLPKFDKKIPYYAIHSSSLHITFWRVQPALNSPQKYRYVIECECFVSLTKFTNLDYSIRRDPNTNISYLQSTVDLQEKTWLHGRQVGRASIKFHFSMQAHQRQMQACVRTEEGILTSSPVFHDKRTVDCEELAELQHLNTDIQKQFIILNQISNNQSSYPNINDGIFRICNLMNLQLACLEKTSKESVQFYQYKNQLELYKGQRFLIDLTFKMTAYVREQKPIIQRISWAILSTILRRGEFKLSHLGFSKVQKEAISSGRIGEGLRLKIDVGLKYQQLLNHLLKETFLSLQFKGDQKERHFAQSFCSYAYFRLPLFRDHILMAIYRQDDPQIPQWRGTQFNLSSQDSSKTSLGKPDDFYEYLFDWQANFYQCLSTQQKYHQNYKLLQQILIQDRWKDRVSRRGGAFFTFLQNLVQEIQYVSVVSKYIKWHALPGYTRLLHAFLVELKSLRICNYNDRLRTCCVRLLANQKLLNILVVILLKKTNVHEADTIYGTFGIFDQFFKFLSKNCRRIPSTFDYKFLLQGIKVVLDGELQYCICQVLLLFFNHCMLFAHQFALQLSLYLLSRYCFRLFFHWSFNIRRIFHMLLLTRITSLQQKLENNRNKPQNNYITDLKSALNQRYDQVIQTIKQEIETAATSFNIDHLHQKELFQKMIFKARNTIQRRVSSKYQINVLIPQSVRQTRSLETKSGFSKPIKLFYLSETDVKLIPMKPQNMCYVQQSLAEFNIIKDQLAETLKMDRNLIPDIQVKKMVDEKEYRPMTADEW